MRQRLLLLFSTVRFILRQSDLKIEEAIKNKKFRQDLYYRLNVVLIELPPLRKRKEDIPFLANHFIKKYSIIYQKKVEGIDEDALELLTNWNWQGNVRELENVIEYALIKTKREGALCICCLPTKILGSIKCNKKSSDAKNIFYKNNAQLIELLNEQKWNKTKVAEILGIDRTTLWRKLKSIGIN